MPSKGRLWAMRGYNRNRLGHVGTLCSNMNDKVIPSMDFFLPWWLGYVPGWQCQDSLGCSCERVEHEDTCVSGSTRSHFHTWNGPDFTPIKVFLVCCKRLKELFDSTVIKTKSQPKMNATGNKCDIAEGCRKQCHSKSAPLSKQKAVQQNISVQLFFWTGSVNINYKYTVCNFFVV